MIERPPVIKMIHHGHFGDEPRREIICNALKIRVISTKVQADVDSNLSRSSVDFESLGCCDRPLRDSATRPVYGT